MLTKVPASVLSVERFEAELQSVCGSFRITPKYETPHLLGAVKHEFLADLEVVHVAKDLNSIKRTKRELMRDDGENFFLIIQEEGQALMSQLDSARILLPGDMILIDSAYVSEFSFFGHFSRQLSVHLPREEMIQRFKCLARGGKFIPKDDHTAIAISAILSKAFQVRDNETQSHFLKEAIFGLVGSMLYEKNGNTSAKLIDAEVCGTQLLKRGMAYINQNFKDPNLTINQVAKFLKVSIRHLQRAFALIGTTPTDYLLSKRLEHVCRCLNNRQDGESKLVSTIAYDCGFNDISNFNKQFSKAFNCPPSKYHEG